MASTGKWATRSVGKPLVDPSGLGRWSGLEYIGKRGRRLAILTAYRSPRQQPTGGFGFYDQQYSMLLSQGVTKPNVRRQFITDLVSFINKLQLDGYEILVSLDANETLGQDTAFGLAHLLAECTLSDLHLLGPVAPPATYKYGSARRIDYMLGTAAVADAVCRAGYNAYDNGVFSKHRGLFVDLDFTQLMGAVDSITPARARGLRSEDQPSVDRYLAAFKTYADDHNLWDRIDDLVTVASTLTPLQCKESFDVIDRDVTRGMLHAEKQAKRPSGKYAWSPKLREAGLLARYWHLRLREVEKDCCLKIPIAALLLRIKSLNIDLADDDCTDAAPLKEKWKKAVKLLRTVRDTAYDHRAVHLLATLTQYHNLTFTEDEECEKAANHAKIARIHRLINIENMRKPFRAIHASMTVSTAGGLSKLFVPSAVKNLAVAAKFCDAEGYVSPAQLIAMAQSDKTSVEYETILDCAAIEDELTRYNRNWFRQAKDTPFGQGELFDLVGYDGLTPQATSIVDGGNLDDFGIPMKRELRVFLEECRRPSSVVPIVTTIAPDDFIATVKAWKESTSTSPSGRHIGHYRTAILDPQVAGLHVKLLNLPIAYGFAPERWTHSVTPLIEKDAGRPYLTRLRVIHLFEADYNLFLKIIYGRRMVKNAEMAQALNDQQHGSRPRRMTTDALFLARLEKDLIRQTKANSAHMDNDATGCYDRIVTSLGMIACRRLGMPEHAIRCQADTLRLMRYAVKHIYGTAATEYTSTAEEPLFGTGQGSGASPAIWLGLVVILLNSLDRMSTEDNIPALSFADPWDDIRTSWRVGAFVDDTNQGVLDATGVLTIAELVEQLRCAGQLWESLLHISGGSLNLSKCSWTLQYWTWINGRPVLNPISTDDPALLMTSGANPAQHIIQQHSNATELKGLGVHMNFMGTFAHHAKDMRIKFDGIARRLRQSSLSTTLARNFYNTFYLPSVRYSLPVTSMTSLELHRVQSLMTSTVLNRLGYNRHYPHAVAFAPTKVFGCGLIDLRIEQGLLQIQALLDYVGTEHRIGDVMVTSLRHLQVEAGVSFDVLQHPQLPLPYLTECWLVSLRRFCAESDISLRVNRNRVLGPVRHGDSLLMDQAATLGLTKQQLVDLNLVRIYLGATTVSDITTADGLMFHPMSWRGARIPDRHSRLTFARQETPTSYQCGLWRKLLRSLLHPTATSTLLLLSTPLGAWSGESYMIWGAMLWDSHLYRQDPFRCRRTASEQRQVAVHFPQHVELSDGSPSDAIFYDSTPDWFATVIPHLATPADLQGCHVFTATSTISAFPVIPEPATTFKEWIQQMPPAEQRMIASHYFSECDAEAALVQYLQLDCTLYIGTDGGQRLQQGSFSWLICSPGQEQLVLNEGPVDGWHRCQSSLRSEAAAIASLAIYLDELACFYEIDICCTFQLYVDSTSAISNVKLIRDRIPKRRYPDNADLLSSIRSAHHVTLRFRLEHVKSHQDDKEDFDKLPFPAQLNVLCDRMATKQLLSQADNELVRTLPCPLPTRTLPVEVFYGSQIVSSHYVARLREAICTARHRIFLLKKYKWSVPTGDLIAWDALSMCATNPKLIHQPNRSKLVHNWLNLGAQRATICARTVLTPVERCCPYCKAPEDFLHLLTCADSRALKFRYDATVILHKALTGGGSGPESLYRAIKQWTLTPTEPVSLTGHTLSVQSQIDCALTNQTAIGWLNLFRGFVSKDWGIFYSRHDVTPSDVRKSHTDKSLANIVRAVQNYSLVIWKSRNAVLHEANSSGSDIVNASLNRAITQLYAIQPTLSTILQSYFALPLADRLKCSPRQRKRWLRLAQLASSHSTSAGSRQQLLSTYFPYAPAAPVYASIAPTYVGVPPVPPILHQRPIADFFTPQVTPP